MKINIKQIRDNETIANKREVYGLLLADQVDGYGRDLRLVFGISSTDPAVYIPQIMAEIRRRCNNNGEIDSTGIPDFRGMMVGDYIDGLDLSGIEPAPGGTAPQAWNDNYKNNQIVIAGFNTYKNSSIIETRKNHILFIFRNVICMGHMKSEDNNSVGYIESELRAWLEGDGITGGVVAQGLNTAFGGNYFYSIQSQHSQRDNRLGNWYKLFLPSEIEVFGYQTFGDELDSYNINVQFPIYAKTTVFKCKRLNGSRVPWWISTGIYWGDPLYGTGVVIGSMAAPIFAYDVIGISPAFCAV